MNEKIYKKIVENSAKFVPRLFTYRQVTIIKKYMKKDEMTKTEQAYFYSVIKKKVEVLSLFQEEFYFNGKNMIEGRVAEAKNILNNLNTQAFISGTFLFSEHYNDIDIYVISNKRKQYHKGKKHFIFITEEDLKKPIFFSALSYSASNFFIHFKEPEIKRPSFDEVLMVYEDAIIGVLDNDDQKLVRALLFEYFMQIKKEVLDSFSLYKKFNEIKNKALKERITCINNMTRDLLLTCYSSKYVYNGLSPFVSRLKKEVKHYKANDNLLIYIDLFNEVKDECRRVEA